MIHPTAVIHPNAKLGSSVRVGPFAVIDEAVEIGPQCVIGPHVYLTGVTKIGSNNQFHAGCVIGDAPQDLKYDGAPTRLRIGDHNVFREHVTVHRSTHPDGETVVGSRNFLMANSHVGHNARVGDHVILANGVLLAGHVVVQDRAFLSGNCVVHQFIRVGTLALAQGGSRISVDLPPFTIATNLNEICGLNVIGLRRAGFNPEERLELKRLYHALFRGGKPLRAALEDSRTKFSSAPAKILMDFVASAKRGVCADSGARKLREETETNRQE
ncbi:MAG TPA: acyl-ACP--UDP-N-acetylglucosamine O-acyltransferase [Verrucomicrobiae bacterium]|nr:acyl-ACP--UDP-N-acetylglucosamine O-acyltransferase [Verrucomicrobiae bacterium]